MNGIGLDRAPTTDMRIMNPEDFDLLDGNLTQEELSQLLGMTRQEVDSLLLN